MLVLYIIIGELNVYYLFWFYPGLGVIFFSYFNDGLY